MGTTMATATTTNTTAKSGIYTIDKKHSEASFQVRHLVTRVRGRFPELEGTIVYNAENPEASSVNFTIDAGSIDTNTPDRDAHLRSEDFFHVEQHPKITFVSSSITRTGDDRYDVTGTLTIRGVSKTITLPVTHLGGGKDPWGTWKIGFEAETTLNRKDFGLLWNAALETGGFLVGDDVKVTLNIEADAK
jgi:polyisoprenoid-binding protein YceI